jgi:hypothetical protein
MKSMCCFMYSIYPWKHLRTHHFASSKKKNFSPRPPLPGLVACTAKKASYAPDYSYFFLHIHAHVLLKVDLLHLMINVFFSFQFCWFYLILAKLFTNTFYRKLGNIYNRGKKRLNYLKLFGSLLDFPSLRL